MYLEIIARPHIRFRQLIRALAILKVLLDGIVGKMNLRIKLFQSKFLRAKPENENEKMRK